MYIYIYVCVDVYENRQKEDMRIPPKPRLCYWSTVLRNCGDMSNLFACLSLVGVARRKCFNFEGCNMSHAPPSSQQPA